MAIRLILADEHPVYLLGLQYLLSNHPEFEVAASCANGEEALQAIREHRPDMLVLELYLPKKNSLNLIREILTDGLRPKVVILTASLDEDQLLDVIRLGVRGVVLKSMTPDLFIRCLQKIQAGGEWLENHSASLALEKLLRRETEKRNLQNRLTSREMELLRLAATGMRNQDIAGRLFISEGTVKTHLHKVFDKLQVTNRVELSTLARNNGWI